MTDLVQTFAALADPTRLMIVERLLAQGEMPAGDLAAPADISAPAVSRHLKVLRKAGLVAQRIEGPKRLYSIRARALEDIADWTRDRRAFWMSSLDRLDDLVARDNLERDDA